MYPSLVLVQPRKIHPCLTEKLLMGRKESNQTNKNMYICFSLVYNRDEDEVYAGGVGFLDEWKITGAEVKGSLIP